MKWFKELKTKKNINDDFIDKVSELEKIKVNGGDYGNETNCTKVAYHHYKRYNHKIVLALVSQYNPIKEKTTYVTHYINKNENNEYIDNVFGEISDTCKYRLIKELNSDECEYWNLYKILETYQKDFDKTIK
jgi:hypothetical protein